MSAKEWIGKNVWFGPKHVRRYVVLDAEQHEDGKQVRCLLKDRFGSYWTHWF